MEQTSESAIPTARERTRERRGSRQRAPFSRSALACAAFLGVLSLMAICAPLLTDASPTAVAPAARLQPPSTQHWLGTDDLGRDVFARLVYGARVSLLVGAAAMLGAAGFGVLLGLAAGYYYRFDNLIMRILDGLMAFPGILLAIAITTALGPSLTNVVIALIVVYTPVVARVARSSTLVNKRRLYVISARSIGLPDHIILRRYVLVNSISPLIVQCTFIVAFAIIAEASLSFLGAGIDPQTPSWGNMLRDGQRLLARAWWLWFFPGLALFLTVLALNVLGDGLRDALDPRSSGAHRVGRWR